MIAIALNSRVSLSIIFLLFASIAPADEQRSATTVAKWDVSGNNKSIIINVSDLLTPGQREIVNSGFSTFTLLAVSEKKLTNSEALPDMRLICSVKYDTWEERYQMIRVDPPPVRTLIVKDYKTWADECLRYSINDLAVINSMSNGGSLNAILQIRQSTPDEGLKIKNWLVSQQSGFMQGLYAHMLGDFQFKGTVRVNIQVPTQPGITNEHTTKPITSKKGL